MITNKKGEKMTPKQKAEEIISGILNTSFDILSQEVQFRDEDWTDREWKLIQKQMHQYLIKFDKVLGVIP